MTSPGGGGVDASFDAEREKSRSGKKTHRIIHFARLLSRSTFRIAVDVGAQLEAPPGDGDQTKQF